MSKYLLYDGTVELLFDEATHSYSVDATRVDGVTGVLSVISKPALIYWAVGECLKHVEANLPLGIALDEITKSNLLKEARYAHKRTSDQAAEIGSFVHQWAEDWIAGRNPEMPVNPKIKSSVTQFIKWTSNNDIKFIHSEKLVYSKKHKYAGTFDFICEIGGKRYIGDFKSSSAIYEEYWLQVAAYQQAYLEEFPEEKIDGAIIVRLGKDNTLEVVISFNYDSNVEGFNHALGLYRSVRGLKNEKKST